MSVTTSDTSTNIQLEVLQFGGYSFPPQSAVKVEYVNGMKEGIATVFSPRQIILAKMSFHEDKLDGLSTFFDSKGIREKEMFFKNESHFNWGREFKEDKIVFEGFYSDGERYSKLCKHSGTDGFQEEVREGKIVSISQYNDNHEKIGKGQLFEYVGEELKEVFDIEDGEKSVKRIEFDNQQMKELNDNGCIIYEGGFQGNPREGFKRNGEGDEFDDNGLLVYSGSWKNGERNGNGMLYDNGFVIYNGEWSQGRPYGNGKLYNNDGEVIMERMWRNEYDDLSNGIFRISDDCYIEIDKNEVYVNELKSSGLFGCSHRWRRRSFSKLSENDKNDLMKRRNDIDKINDTKSAGENDHRLTIKVFDELVNLFNNSELKRSVKGLVIDEGCGNEMKNDLRLCGFENLEKLVVKKNSLKNLSLLRISDNPVLNSIEIEDGDMESNSVAFLNVKNTVISSIMISN